MATWSAVIKGIPASFTAFGGVKLVKLKKAMPGIELGASIVLSGLAVYSAAKAGMKARDILDEYHENLESVKKAKKVADEMGYDYSDEDAKEDENKATAKMVVDMAKTFTKPVACEVGADILKIHSHRTMVKRLDVAVAAFNAVNSAYIAQREAVLEKNEEIAEHNKKEPKEKAKVNIDPVAPGASPYAVIFEKYRSDGHLNPNWIGHADTMVAFLEGQEVVANRLLHSRGHLFLNDIFSELLGLPDTQVGALVGWVDDDDITISFGLDNPENIKRLKEGEPSMLLDFNVQGTIYDKI